MITKEDVEKAEEKYNKACPNVGFQIPTVEDCVNKQNIISAMSEIMEIDNDCNCDNKQDEVIRILINYFGIPNHIEITGDA